MPGTCPPTMCMACSVTLLPPLPPHRVESVFCEKRDDPTGFTSALRDTELVGKLSSVSSVPSPPPPYPHKACCDCSTPCCFTTGLPGTLHSLHLYLLTPSPSPLPASRPSTTFPFLTCTWSRYTADTVCIGHWSEAGPQPLQACLGAEGISLEFRHVASYLMWFVPVCVCV